MAEIRWPKQDHLGSTGRNGCAYTTGVQITVIGGARAKSVNLQPITSQNKLQRCDIGLPYDYAKLMAIVEQLRTIAAEALEERRVQREVEQG